MQEEKKELSIIVVAYKNVPILTLCLKTIIENIPKDICYEIILVEVEQSEEIRDLIAEDFPQIKYFPFASNIGFAKALNYGIKQSRGEIILSLNPDITVKKKAIKTLYNFIKKNPKAGLIGPKLLNFNGSHQNSCFRFYTPLTVLYRRTLLGKIFGKNSLKEFAIQVENKKPKSIRGWLMGSALMFRKDHLKKVGLMDERYFMYFEDVDWSRRFLEHGLKIFYIPQAQMFHYHSKMSASTSILSILFNRMTFIHLLSGIKYFLKFKGWKVTVPLSKPHKVK